jgi:DNA repair ATPase RecN
MTSEIVEPELERVKLSLAEENLLEQIRNYISRLEPLLHEIEGVMDDLFKQKFESARTRIAKVYEDLKSVYETRLSLTRYASKVATSIANGFYYMSLVESLTLVTDYMHRLSLDLTMLCSSRLSLSESLTIYIQNAVGQMREYLSSVREMFLYLIENPSKVSRVSTFAEKKFYDILQVLKNLYESLEYEKQEPMLLDTITTLTSLAYSLRDLGEKTVWIYIVRAP